MFKLLKELEHLFDGTLGNFNTTLVSIELKPDAKPYHARPYPVPAIFKETVRKEVQRLCDIGVLEKCNESAHAAPTFIIANKSGTVRAVSDFQHLNANVKRKPFPIPKISDLILELEGFSYATAFDLIMGLMFVQTYLDDLLIITTGSFHNHMEHIRIVLQRLSDAGLHVNADKSTFCAEETEYLGFWIPRHGVQPMTNKIEAILNIAPPSNRNQLRWFIGMVNYYRDMWIRRSDLLAPLTALTSTKTRWAWTTAHQNAFNKIKDVLSQEGLLAFQTLIRHFIFILMPVITN
jgi:Reverse transcriptase (RNA-dependent DNA polymerase)